METGWTKSRRLKQALTLEPLLDAAFTEAGTGATEFRDASFLPNLEKALEIPTRLDLSARGLMGVHANFARFLVNRLRWEADVERHPEILDEDVSDPIVVLGLPRSGTTKLQRFLSADPNVQATPAWMMFNPAPFPGEQRGDPRPRIEWANAMMSSSPTPARPIRSCTNSTRRRPTNPASSRSPISTTSCSSSPRPTIRISNGRARSAGCRRRTYLKKMLQVSAVADGRQARRPWVLKNPGNTGEVAEMLEVFPNATFVISQRDLVTTMGSSMRMGSEILQNTFDAARSAVRRAVDGRLLGLRAQALPAAAAAAGRHGPPARGALQPLRQRCAQRRAGSLRAGRPALDRGGRGGDARSGTSTTRGTSSAPMATR